MSFWESTGRSDEWYTPKRIFDALGCRFDLDVAAPSGRRTHVPARAFIAADSLDASWAGFIWMNPPFGGRNGLVPWLDKFFEHRDGIALTPDRTSAPWWQSAASKADAILFVSGKVKFERPDGSVGRSPSTGTTLFAAGQQGTHALAAARRAGLGLMLSQPALVLQEAA